MNRLKTSEEYKLINKNEGSKLFYSIEIFLIISLFALVVLLFFNNKTIDSNTKFKIKEICIQAILAYYIALCIHEGGHLLALKIYGYNMRLFLAGPFMLINENKKFKFKFQINRFLTGGLVIFNTNDSVSCEEEYRVFCKNIKKILFGGPLLNIIALLMSIIFIKYSSFAIQASLMFGVNFGIIISCTMPYGDIYKIRQLNKNPEDAVIYLLSDVKIAYEMNKFCIEKTNDFIKQKLIKKQYNHEILTIINFMLEFNFIHNEKNCSEIDIFINWLKDNYENIKTKEKLHIRLLERKLLGTVKDLNLIPDKLTIKKYMQRRQMHKVYMQFDSCKKKFDL